jgi:hypothetical protein
VAAVNDIFWNTTCMQLQNAVNFITDAAQGATTTVNSVFSGKSTPSERSALLFSALLCSAWLGSARFRPLSHHRSSP